MKGKLNEDSVNIDFRFCVQSIKRRVRKILLLKVIGTFWEEFCWLLQAEDNDR